LTRAASGRDWALMLPMFLQRWLHDSQERRTLVREARARIGVLVGDAPVVEVGCGFGPNAAYCKGPYLGVDISDRAVQEAKRRHPAKAFLCGDVTTARAVAPLHATVLLCAVMHEIPDYADALRTVVRPDTRRVVICDYDPALRGWLRLWMSVFEPKAGKWWGCRPRLLLPDSEWSVRSGHVTRALLWWAFERRPR
jgi:SAM-dependent methyltransferase